MTTLPQPRLSAVDIARLLEQPTPTSEQQAVIESPLQPALVVAGAGSGKTETMSARVVWLIANSLVEPRHILGLTFTRKAAHELDERIRKRLAALASAMRRNGIQPPESLMAAEAELGSQKPRVATYNGFALDVVHEYALSIGIDPDFATLTVASAWQLAYDIADSWTRPAPFTQKSATIASAIASLSGSLADHRCAIEQCDEYFRSIETHTQNLPLQEEGGRKRTAPAGVKALWRTLYHRRALMPLLRTYEERKRQKNVIDFSDQVTLAARIALENPEVGEHLREAHRVVLLDEFQDTSCAQLDLLRALFGNGHATCAVGDPHQSIYGWRGASSASLAQFVDSFGSDTTGVGQYSLSTSWRNDALILRAANAISAELASKEKLVSVPQLRARPGAGYGHIRVENFDTDLDEAQAIARWISATRKEAEEHSEGLDVRVPSAAVLIRSRSRIPALVDALEAEGLEVSVVGGGGLLHTPEVADVRALLEVGHDSSRGDSLMRLMTGSRFNIAVRDIAVLGQWRSQLEQMQPQARERGDEAAAVGLADALESLPPEDFCDSAGRSLSHAARLRLADLRTALHTVRQHATLEIHDLVTVAIRALGVDIAAQSDPARDPDRADANLEAFRSHAQNYARTADDASLGAFLASLDVAEEEESGLEAAPTRAVSEDAVVISTMHAAKGLEWDLVAIAGLAESSFPSYRRNRVTKDSRNSACPVPKDPGWLDEVAYSSIPVDLRGDSEKFEELAWAEAETLVDLDERIEEFKVHSGEQKLLEERRLMYVAVTRARSALLLTWAAWSEGASTPRGISRFLRDLREVEGIEWVEGDEPPLENPLEASPKRVLWPELDPGGSWTLSASGEVCSHERLAELHEATQHVIAAKLASKEHVDVVMPNRLSPSDLVSLSGSESAQRLRHIVRPMPRKPSRWARIGTQFHGWLESTAFGGALVEYEDLDLFSDESEESVRLSVAELREKFARSQFAAMTPLAIEEPVGLILNNAYLPGVIDAVYPDPGDEGGVWIVDWKTGRVPHGEELKTKGLQLSVYRLAWHQRTGVPLDRIRTMFHYVAAEQTVEIREHVSEQQLSEMIGALET